MRAVLSILIALTLLAPAAHAETPLDKVSTWIGGLRSNIAQIEAGEPGHALLYQRMTQIAEHGWDGIAFYSELSADGSVDTLQSQTVLTFDIDETTGAPYIRSWRFTGDRTPYLNAHMNPEVLNGLGPDVMRTTPGCEIPLTVEADRMTGSIAFGDCTSTDPRSGQKLIHTDNYAVGPDFQEMNGRFYSESEVFLFGNRAETPIIMRPVDG